jgi:hypothetical protein
MDKNIIKQYLGKTFLSEVSKEAASGTPGIRTAAKMSKDNAKVNKAGVGEIGKDMNKYEKGLTKTDPNEKQMAQNKINYNTDDEKNYHDQMEIMNGQEMIQYDRTPNKVFKDRAMEAIEGSTRMGNNPEWANVVAKGQGGDPEFGKNLVKSIKASEKKRSEQTPTTKMFGNDWEVTNDKSHKSFAFEGTKGKSVIKEDFGVDRSYTHFFVFKKNGKIVDGFDYSDSDSESMRDYAKIDLKDNDYYPSNKYPVNTAKDFTLVSGKYLQKQGINPYDWKNWYTERHNDEPSEDKTQGLNAMKGLDADYEKDSRGQQYGINPYDGMNENKNKDKKLQIKEIKKMQQLTGIIKENKDLMSSANNEYISSIENDKPIFMYVVNNRGHKEPQRITRDALVGIFNNYEAYGPIEQSEYAEKHGIPVENITKILMAGKYFSGRFNLDMYGIKEVDEPQIKETMKRLKFKKEFNGVGNALKLIPEAYKVDSKTFEMTDGNETYKIRWEGSLTEGKAVVLTATDKKMVSEDIQKMKHLFNYNSSSTLGTVKGKNRLDENKAFTDVWNKTKALLAEPEEELNENVLGLDANTWNQILTPLSLLVSTGALGLAGYAMTKKQIAAAAEAEGKTLTPQQLKDATSQAMVDAFEKSTGGGDATPKIFEDEEEDGEESMGMPMGRKDAYDASLDVVDPEDMEKSMSKKDIEKSTSEPAMINKDAMIDDEDEDGLDMQQSNTELKLAKSTRTGEYAIITKMNGKVMSAVNIPDEMAAEIKMGSMSMSKALAKIKADKEEAEMSDEELMEAIMKMTDSVKKK